MYLMNGMLAKKFELDDGLMSLRRIFNVFTDDKLPIQINSFFVFVQIRLSL